MSTSTNNLSTWLPKYLHFFNFPPHINPEILLNLEPNKYTKLEENLYVYYSADDNVGSSCLSFEFTASQDHNTLFGCDHNPYGPSTLWDDGDYVFKILGKYHRLNGPAYFIMKERSFYIEGIEYPDELSFYTAVTQYKTLHNLP